tara:strand:- start:39 stop:935 length:897 start_codon:yes stop_codon:yes gene_type:complete
MTEALLTSALAAFDDQAEDVNREQFWSIFQKICEEGNEHISDASDYAEPGYSLDDEKMPILLANWNAETRWNNETRESETLSRVMPLLGELAENNGCSIEWSDEWQVCECRKAFRTSPDSHGWTMYGAIISGEYVCGDCVKEDPTEYFEEIEGDPTKAITIVGINPEDHNYVRVNSEPFEHGLYGGQDASPQAISEILRSVEIDTFLFSIDGTGQFDLRFSVYVPSDEKVAAAAALSTGNTRCEVDPAVALEQGLKAATKEMAAVPDGDGVRYATVNSDGTASARMVTPEEFIAGIKK